jgi:Ni/Co efflux regulator RcnB
MKATLALVLAAGMLAAWPAAAQAPERGAHLQKQGLQPREREREERRELRRDRGGRERLSREQRDKLRQDILDANRDMKGRR